MPLCWFLVKKQSAQRRSSPPPRPSNPLRSETRSANRCFPSIVPCVAPIDAEFGSVCPLVVTSGPIAELVAPPDRPDRLIARVVLVRRQNNLPWHSLAEVRVTCVDVVVAADQASAVPVGPMVRSVGPTNPVNDPPVAPVDARPPTSALLYYSGAEPDIFAGPRAWQTATRTARRESLFAQASG